jgi:hypothetical protein
MEGRVMGDEFEKPRHLAVDMLMSVNGRIDVTLGDVEFCGVWIDDLVAQTLGWGMDQDDVPSLEALADRLSSALERVQSAIEMVQDKRPKGR